MTSINNFSSQESWGSQASQVVTNSHPNNPRPGIQLSITITLPQEFGNQSAPASLQSRSITPKNSPIDVDMASTPKNPNAMDTSLTPKDPNEMDTLVSPKDNAGYSFPTSAPKTPAPIQLPDEANFHKLMESLDLGRSKTKKPVQKSIEERYFARQAKWNRQKADLGLSQYSNPINKTFRRALLTRV